MFVLREYAACLLVALSVGALLLAGGGIFLTLRAAWRIAARAVHSSRGFRIRRAHVVRIAALVSVLLLVILLRAARANGPWASPTVQDDGYTIRVRVGQVVLHTTVQNRKGTSVSGLSKDNFRIYEDGAPQEIR